MTSSPSSTSSLINNQNLTSLSLINASLDPDSPFVIKWRRLMLIICVLSIIVDPFFLYVPDAKGPTCLGVHYHAAIVVSFFRTLLDVFSRNFIKDPHLIAIKYLKSRFIIDLIAIVPLPQIIVLSSKFSSAYELAVTLTWQTQIVYGQFVPRLVSLVPMDTKTIESNGILVKHIWSGAIYNLFVFILAGHYFGACYYLMYLRGLSGCLLMEYKEHLNDYGSRLVELNCSQVHQVCVTKHNELDEGMLSDAFANEIGSRTIIQKLIYCFVWGVRSLSSLGQIFDASFDVWETTFSCVLMIAGLIFLADLIARMQTSVQSAGARRDRQRVKQRKLEEWTHYHDLPHDLKGRVRHIVQSEWQATKGIDDEAILNSLPSDLRRDIRNHLYKERVSNMPPFMRMDNQLLDFVCGHLRTFLRAEGTYIVLQGDPVEQIVFVFSGLLQLSNHNAGHSNSRSLEPGDFFGEELLIWASQPNSSSHNLPPSTCTVKCLSNVEAFCLPAEDVRLLSIFNYSLSFQKALRAHQP